MFVAGAAIGSVATWKLLKTKYEQIAQEEIDSVKEVAQRKIAESEAVRVAELGHSAAEGIAAGFDYVADKPDIKEVAAKLACNLGYTENNEEEGEVESMDDRPYVIDPNEFDTLDDYDCECLTLYADGVITDEYDEIIEEEDLDDMIGLSSLEQLEDDSVYVRNDDRKCDYEVVKDYRNYRDVFPHLVTTE